LKSKDNFLQITCDGGASTGKSTGAKLIAKKYKLAFLSSGLLYRYAGYLIIKYNPKNNTNFLKKKFKNLNYKKLAKLNLHTPKISALTADIAKVKKIRNILKIYQKNFIKKNKNCVLEGRDASTKILPNSDLKFYFICNLNIAARRRYRDLRNNSKKIKFSDVKKALYKRNLMDKSRKISPLQKHRDAVVVNTGKLSKNAVLDKMSKHVNNFLINKYGKQNRLKR
jgi:cytidylate kinase|tara:strand:- start:33 stop:707 length:675 start_codon:yes stop_codon:yes gene_type:complete